MTFAVATFTNVPGRRVGRFAGRLDSFFAGQHFGDFRGRRFAARNFQVTDRFDVRRRFAFVLDDHLVFDGFRRRDDPFKVFVVNAVRP